ncbi:MAG TPA: polysaccharide biosynthesis tyrosine autokinase [Allosphingosinicella sp.]|nr:polysaccharide biosynthesis tyrosine autokinase [Allosphingosinicella sp.]
MNDLTQSRAPADGPRGVDAPRGTSGYPGGDETRLVVRYLRIALRWRWLIIGVTVAAIIAGLIITYLTTPLYTAEATLEIQRENDRITQVRGVEPETSSVDMEFYQTQYGLLQSRSLAERVATDLRLYSDPNFFEMFGDDETAARVRESPLANNQATRQDRVRRAGVLLLRQLAVSPVRLSRLVSVRFTGPDPAFSARVVNSWTRNFIETTLERRLEATSYARRFLERELGRLRGVLEESERRLVAYASEQRIINIPSSVASSATPGGTQVTERPLVADDLAALNEQLNQATAARLAAGSRLRGGGGTTPEALQNQAISSLRARRADLAAERARLLTQFEPDYPPARALANQIADLDRSIGREEGRVRSTLDGAYQAAVEREQGLRSRVEGLQRDLLNLRGRTIQYNIFQRDVDTNRQLYEGLLQRYKEVGVAGGVGVNNVSIVDAGQTPLRPSSPSLIRNMLVALLLGGILGVGLAFAFEQIDETISDPTDVEKAVGLPLLGTIPKSTSNQPIEELADRKSPLVEAYLSTQTSLAFTTSHGVPRSLTVTSTRPAEGKSFTALALAQSLARTGRRVALIDADMRSPSLHHIFAIGNERGLSNYLAGDNDIGAMMKPKLAENLTLLTAGPPPPNAAELLVGDRISALVGQLTEQFDHVIFDAPPVMGLADTPLIASRVEGTIFILESHSTPLSMARVAISRLRDAQATVLGVLLTKFESKRAHYGYGYDYGYGYGQREGKDTPA